MEDDRSPNQSYTYIPFHVPNLSPGKRTAFYESKHSKIVPTSNLPPLSDEMHVDRVTITLTGGIETNHCFESAFFFSTPSDVSFFGERSRFGSRLLPIAKFIPM